MKTELFLRTLDHPEARGRTPKIGERVYETRFPLEDGRELILQMGEDGFQKTTDLLMDMLTYKPSHNDGSTNLPSVS